MNKRMKKYKVYINESMCTKYVVEADNTSDARDIAEKMHYEGDVPENRQVVDCWTDMPEEII